MSNSNLYDTKEAVEFYDKRYQDGYMEEWDETKKDKVREVIRLLHLPETGKALDFGCGNGVFTNIIKQALPKWDVYGVEISPTAIRNAKEKFPACNFFGVDEAEQYLHQFDFLFSHHVIEHVQELVSTFEIINSYLKDSSFQLHILPCGNKNSFEYNLCTLLKNGIEIDNGNRFFFEEPGHLRRLSSDEFTVIEKNIGFELKKEFYSNQYYGAINWITKSSPRFVKKLTDSTDAISNDARLELNKLRKKILPLTYLQFPYSKYWALKSKWFKRPADYLKMILFFIPAMFSRPFYLKYEKESANEWASKKTESNGSEMFLFFERTGI